jgi:hypothetical protein
MNPEQRILDKEVVDQQIFSKKGMTVLVFEYIGT